MCSRSLLCAAIEGPSTQHLAKQLAVAETSADLVEWRTDMFQDVSLAQIEALKQPLSIPSLFTLRPAREGGKYAGSEIERLELLRKLAALNPAYLDIEWDVPRAYIEQLAIEHPQVKIILSRHYFEATPDNLETIYSEMSRKPAHFYKIAAMANSTLDALRMLQLCQQHPERLIGLCMGETGQLTRIAGALFCAPLSYGAADQGTALGQVPLKEMLELYHYRALNPSTRLLGLIGNPVNKSPSHYTHNKTMQQLGVDGIYVKMQLQEHELPEFIERARQLRFSGLSITMPLKEAILPCLHALDAEAAQIGAVNTVVFHEKQAKGYNTDGIGALHSIEELGPVAGQTVLILGAGGAARAIAFEALKRGSHVIVLNRHRERAEALAHAMKSERILGDSLDNVDKYAERYQILINATPADMPIEPQFMQPGTIAMDIMSRPMTTFLLAAEARRCRCIPGCRMFIHQAAEQFRLWFGNEYAEAARELIASHLKNIRL